MRIGILLPSIVTSKRHGIGRIFAPQTAVEYLAEALMQQGHSVKIYAADNIKKSIPVEEGDHRFFSGAPEFFQLRNRSAEMQNLLSYWSVKYEYELHLTMRAYQQALEGKLDIIHAHAFIAHYFAEITRFPTLFTLHDALPQSKSTLEYIRYTTFANHPYTSISHAQLDSIVTLNAIKTIHHGIPVDQFPFSRDSNEQLLYFGRLIPEKGVDLAIRAAHAEKKSLVVLTTASPFNRSDTYFNKLIKPFLNSSVKLVAQAMNNKDRLNMIKKAKAFIFPLQWNEPFGLVFIESMACGTPVIAYANGSAPEVIRDGVTGFLVNPDDKKIRGDYIIKQTGLAGLQKAIERLYSLSPNDYQSMRRACREHVEKHFSAERMAREYVEAYRTVINKKL